MRSFTSTLLGALLLSLFVTSCDSTEPGTVEPPGVWKSAPGLGIRLVEVQQRDAGHITAAGLSGAIFQSSDGGRTWTQRSNGLTEDIFRIERINDSLMLALGGNDVLRSTDDGVTWGLLTSVDPDRRLRGITVLGSDIIIVGSQTSGNYGFILRSDDNGKTLDEVHYSNISGIYGISFFDQQRGVAAGKLGRIYLTSDAGMHWTMQPQLAGQHQFTGVQAFPDGSALAYGGTGGVTGFVYRSTDYGLTWSKVYEGLDRIERMSFSPEMLKNGGGGNSGAIGGTSAAYGVGENGLIVRSNDGGKSWTTQPSLGDVYWRGVSIYASNRGIMVGDDGSVATLSPAD